MIGVSLVDVRAYPRLARTDVVMKTQDVKIGQRFRKRDRTAQVWEVVAIGAAHDPIPHVRLIREGDPSDIKVVSVVALIDSSYYVLENDRDFGRTAARR